MAQKAFNADDLFRLSGKIHDPRTPENKETFLRVCECLAQNAGVATGEQLAYAARHHKHYLPNPGRKFISYLIARGWLVRVERKQGFEKWVNSLPQKHWAKYDLAACELGWNAAGRAP